jgi:predicted O-methyltransferase YrrM
VSEARWEEVERWICDRIVPSDDGLRDAVAEMDQHGMPSIQVEPPTGKLLHLLARMIGARRILEIGTLGGYSTIWLARALPQDGTLITLELDPHHAEVARANLKSAGLDDKAQVRVGRAVDSLAALAQERPEPFDLVFIDADKPSNADYLQWALRLSRPGTVIVVDNVVRNGEVVDPDSSNEAVQGVRRLVDVIAAEPRLTATAIQTTGVKGYDGFIFAIVES